MQSVTRDTIIDGRYRVMRRIGAGGMADVYCVEDTQLGRRVALKLLYRRFAEDDEFVERFRREASAAAGLQHPNVVQVFDRGEWDGTYYIAMEYVAGRSLKEIVREEGALDPDRAIDLVLQVLKAARFAHKRGIVHRDLKPQNVLVDEEGTAKVADFGIARAGASDMTETGSIMGTAQYLSPEQAQGHAVDGRADLYSIGIMLYELLTGRVPFDAEAAVTIALKQVSEEPVPPSRRNPAVSPALEAVVGRALQKDPANRYQSAEAFAAALESARDAPVGGPRAPLRTGAYPVAAEAVTPYPGGEPERRGGRGWLVALAVVLASARASWPSCSCARSRPPCRTSSARAATPRPSASTPRASRCGSTSRAPTSGATACCARRRARAGRQTRARRCSSRSRAARGPRSCRRSAGCRRRTRGAGWRRPGSSRARAAATTTRCRGAR